ncbi:MAG TPA: hypothetical protein VF661_13070, partial [Actinomycetales bacterium]
VARARSWSGLSSRFEAPVAGPGAAAGHPGGPTGASARGDDVPTGGQAAGEPARAPSPAGGAAAAARDTARDERDDPGHTWDALTRGEDPTR